MSTNLIRNADHTRIHLDTSHDNDKEWTFLVYLTPNWTQNFYGETAFFERNSDDTEIVAEVRPRYGRAVIFQGTVKKNIFYASQLLITVPFILHAFSTVTVRQLKLFLAALCLVIGSFFSKTQ